MRLSANGQVTIPAELRQRYGLGSGTEVELQAVEGGILIRKVDDGLSRGRALVEHMRGRATSGLTTNEILGLTRG